MSVDSDFIQELQARLGLSKSTDVTRVALSLLDWASEEVRNDRVILSSNAAGADVHRLVMPELQSARKLRKK